MAATIATTTPAAPRSAPILIADRVGPGPTAAVAKKPATAATPRQAAQPGTGWFSGQQPAASHKAYGHQLSVTRSPTNLSAPQFR